MSPAITATNDFNSATFSPKYNEMNNKLYLQMEERSQRQMHVSLGTNLVTTSRSRAKQTTH